MKIHVRIIVEIIKKFWDTYLVLLRIFFTSNTIITVMMILPDNDISNSSNIAITSGPIVNWFEGSTI